jgi:DNA-binding transcriptional regulator YhcF (GntR family)
MRTKRTEAKLLGYTLFYDLTGKLVTERTSTDISELKKYFTKEEFNTLATVLREASNKLDEVHSYIEAYLNNRLTNN